MKTKRCILRRFTLADFENMRELESNPKIMQFTPAKVPRSIEEIRTRLENSVKNISELEPYGVWAAETIEHDFVGWFMLIKTDLPHPELGFMIIERNWGKKYSLEISEAIIDYGFNTLHLPAISARTTPDNFISIKVLEKAGFKFTGTMTNAAGDLLNVYELTKF